MNAMKFIAVFVVSAALAAWGLLGKSRAESELTRVADARDQAFRARDTAEKRAIQAEADAAGLGEQLATARKALSKAKEDLEHSRRSTIDLQAEVRAADDRVAAAEGRVQVAAAARQAAEATASDREREAADARAGLAAERGKPAVPSPADTESGPTPVKKDGKAAAACAAIAQAINLRARGDLTDPEKLATAHLEWLGSEGGWSAREIADLGSWLSEYWRQSDALGEMKAGGAKKRDIEAMAKKMDDLTEAALQVRKDFLDGDPVTALKTFRFWNPRFDFSK